MKNSLSCPIVGLILPLTQSFIRCVMALIRGYMGKCPCPVCLVPKDELLTATKVYPLRTCCHTEATLAEARTKSREEMEALLKEHGLRDVDVSYTLVFTIQSAYAALYFTECIFYYAPW